MKTDKENNDLLHVVPKCIYIIIDHPLTLKRAPQIVNMLNIGTFNGSYTYSSCTYLKSKIHMQMWISRHLCKTLTLSTKNLTSQDLQSMDWEPVQWNTLFSLCQNNSFMRIILNMLTVTAFIISCLRHEVMFLSTQKGILEKPLIYFKCHFICKVVKTKTSPLSASPKTRSSCPTELQTFKAHGNTFD